MPDDFLSQALQHLKTLIELLERTIAAPEQQQAAPNPPPTRPPSVASDVVTAPASPLPTNSFSQPTQLVILKYGPEAEEAGLPRPIRALVARWLAEHGADKQTAREWLDLPLDDYMAALLSTKRKLDAAHKTRSQHRYFHHCQNLRCPCQTMEESTPGPTWHAIAVFLVRHGANFTTVKSPGWRQDIPREHRGALLFAKDKIYRPGGAAAHSRGVRLHRCDDVTCICYEVLEA